MVARVRKSAPWSMGTEAVSTWDAQALKALGAGNANEGQQKRALKFIIEQVSGTYDQTFDPESERASAFAEGKRYVGRKIVGILNLPIETFKKIQGEQPK